MIIEYALAVWVLRGGIVLMPDRYDATQCEAARAAVEAQFKSRAGYGTPPGGAVCVPRRIGGL